MDIDDRRTPADEVGVQVGAGRDATIHAVGSDRVLRRTADERDHRLEAMVMEHVRAAGFPVPRVFRIGPGEMVLARIDGPTMVDDLRARPWRTRAHARTLADLHTRLHAIEAPAGLARHGVVGSSILHLDLHPGNVLCSPEGPVVIDWTNVRVGDPAADVAQTWLLMGAFELDEEPVTGSLGRQLLGQLQRSAIPRIRRRVLRAFLDATGMEDRARAVLAATAEERLSDRTVRPGEAAAVRALVARETGARRARR